VKPPSYQPPSPSEESSPEESSPQEELFRLLVQSVTDYAIYMLNPEGVLTTWNAGAERIKGYAAREIIGQHFSKFYVPEDVAAGLPQHGLAVAAREGRYEKEGWRIRKDGTKFWASVVIDAIKDDDGKLIGFAKVTRDITQRRAALEALRESEQRFRMLVQGVTDYAIYMLDPTGHVSNWNAGGQRIKGYSTEEIVGQHFSKFYAPEDVARGLPQLGLATAAREGRYENEGWRVRRDGSRFWASVVIDAIKDDAGQLLGFAKVTRDITERRITAEKLEKAQAALIHAQKMEAIGQLTGGVAHDFNNLLTVVINNLEMLGSGERSPRERKLLDAAHRAADRGARLTQQLLAFARRQPLRPAIHNPNVIIKEFEEILRRSSGDAVEMIFDLSSDVTNISVDTAQFESALLNLVINARDATPKGGRITITSRQTELDPSRAETIGLPQGRYVEIRVSDNGTGMTEEVMSRATEPFFTTKDVGKGSGLGLSQVYGFVAQSGGQIEISSKLDHGTAISLYLPVAAGDAVMKDEESPVQKSAGTVLLVEDDPDVQETAVAMLRDLGCHVLAASDAKAAIEIAQSESKIDILFSDIVLPQGMSGVELAQHIERMRPGIRVVLASGYPRSALSGDPSLLDRFAFIAKPYRWTELSDKIRAAMPGLVEKH
jgi:PAS domain S-box-containing protein